MVNSRALESLIKCGALDSLTKNRKQAIKHLELLIPWAQKKAKDKEIGQGNIFDLLGENTQNRSHEDAPKPPKDDDFSTKDKLQFEKELLGFYVSEHPLRSIIQLNTEEDAITLQDLAEHNGKKVKVFLMIVEIKNHVTKKGDQMAFLQVEDLSGQAEAIVFPRTYQEVKGSLEANQSLLVTGKVDKQEDKIQLIVDEIKSVEHLLETVKPAKNLSSVRLNLTPEEIQKGEIIENLKMILQEYRSNESQTKYPVEAIVSDQYLVRFGYRFWVEDPAAIVERLKSGHFKASIFNGD